MSLSSFLNQPDVRARFKQEFPKPNLRTNHELLAPPLTKNYSQVGTAFDYLMRFFLKSLNPQAIERNWVAENSLSLLSAQGFHHLAEQANLIVNQARENYAEFLRTQELSLDLIKSALLLAKLDPFSRRGQILENLQQIDERDVEDLRNMMALVDANLFRTTGGVWLNPTFGEASFLVGGADADLVVDDLILEIKTLRNLKLERDDFNQLIGYYCLSKIGSLNGDGVDRELRKI
jgi:hypothetical protein